MPLTQDALDMGKALRAIGDELSREFYERHDHVNVLLHALLAREHTFMLGPPGTAKSLLVRALCGRITDARYFEILLTRQTPEESVFGPIDIVDFRDTGAWHVKTRNKAAESHIAFLDEIGKAGPTTTDPILTWMNERIYHANDKPMHCPLISLTGASNEELEFPEQAALWDRFLLRLIVEPIQEPGNFAALLQSAVTGSAVTPTEVSLDQIEQATEDVQTVAIPPGVVDSILQLRSDLRAESVTPSDRRWKKSMRLLQAGAYLAGRDTVDDEDLAILRHVLWDQVEQIPEVERKVLALTGPLTRLALELDGMLGDIEQGIEDRRGQSVEERARYGGEANGKLKTIATKVNDAIEKANRQGRSTAKLATVRDRVKAMRVRVYSECLNVPVDRAERMGDA